jgi:hypothetical protein
MTGARRAVKKGIKTPFRPALKKSSPQLPILNEEEVKMKLKETLLSEVIQ